MWMHSDTGGNANNRGMSCHAVSSSCWIHLCIDEECALNSNVVSKQIKEAFIHTSVHVSTFAEDKNKTQALFVHKCVRVAVCTCAAGQVWFISTSSTSSSSSPAEPISVQGDNLCLLQFPKSQWAEALSTQTHTCLTSNTHGETLSRHTHT